MDRDDLPQADSVTVTIGGNDLLGGHYGRAVGDRAGVVHESLGRLEQNLAKIGKRLAAMGCPVIVSTIYDPTDGDDARAAELGLVPEARSGLRAANEVMRGVAAAHGFLLCDLEALFRATALVAQSLDRDAHRTEPRGATAIARAWHTLLGVTAGARPRPSRQS